MTLPFTHAQFFDIFAPYNETVWPLVLGGYMLLFNQPRKASTL